MIDLYLSTNSLCCHAILIGFSGVSSFLAGGEDFGSHIAAGLGPFVVLLGQDGADEADDGVAGRKIPATSVRRRISLLRRSWGLPGQAWRQISRGNAVNARTSSRASSRWAAATGNLASSAVTTWWCWARTDAAPGCPEMVRTRVETQGWADLATLVARLRA